MSKVDGNFTYDNGISLRDYFESRLTAMEQAVNVAHTEMNRRLNLMNEFREQLNKAEGTFITRKEIEANKQGVIAVWLAIASMLISIIGVFYKQ